MKILGLLLIGIVLITKVGKSVDLTCNRLEHNYVTCQQDRSNFYGLWSIPTSSFRLKSAEVKEYEEQDEDTRYYIYKLYLYAENKEIYFHEYGSKFDKAYADIERILDFLSGADQGTSFSLNRRSNVFQDVFHILAALGLIVAFIKRFN